MNENITRLTEYGNELVAAGFEVWLTPTHSRSGGYLQYRDPQTGYTGSLQESYFDGWQHHMPLVPSTEYGSSMWIQNPLPPFTVEAARQCASASNWNDVVGRQPNAGDRQWRSDSAITLHTPAKAAN